MQKVTAILTNPSGWALIAAFAYFGLKGIQSHFTGSVGADIGLVVTFLGMVFHPTDMVGGHRISR